MSEALRAALAAAREPSRATAAAWRRSAEYRALERLFADCPADDPEPGAERAEQLLGDTGRIEALIAPLVAALAADPLFEPPLKSSRDALRTGLVLFDCAAASLSASVTDAAALAVAPAPGAVTLSGRVTVTRYVRGGGAMLRRWAAEAATPAFCAEAAARCAPLPSHWLSDGEVLRCDGRVQGQLVEGARSDVVQLSVTLKGGGAPLIRQYAIADGRLLRVASADEQASRVEMLLTFLRLAGHAEAGGACAAATRDAAFHLRWAAMREWLALDARAALPRLAEMAAGDPHRDVRAAAAHTLALVERRIAGAPCPG